MVANDKDGDRHAARCSNNSLKGTYAFYQYGEVIGQGPAADVGVLTSDGKGNFTGTEVVHNATPQVVDITFCNGHYEVNEDCTGDLTWTAVIGTCDDPIFEIGERTAAITIGKKDVYILSTTPGAVLVGIATKR